MRNLNFKFSDKGIEIHGFPNAVKVIKLESALGRQLADLVLHQSDLEFAAQCLAGINVIPETPGALREGLWRSAIVHVMKCFGSSVSRTALPENKILHRLPPEAKLVFEYFKNLRHKFIVHDENAYTQAMTGALINDGTKAKKIEQVVAFVAVASTLDQANYGNLKLLIDTSLEWTTRRFDQLTKLISDDLEATDYADLVRRDSPAYRAPEVHEVATKRQI